MRKIKAHKHGKGELHSRDWCFLTPHLKQIPEFEVKYKLFESCLLSFFVSFFSFFFFFLFVAALGLNYSIQDLQLRQLFSCSVA